MSNSHFLYLHSIALIDRIHSQKLLKTIGMQEDILSLPNSRNEYMNHVL